MALGHISVSLRGCWVLSSTHSTNPQVGKAYSWGVSPRCFRAQYQNGRAFVCMHAFISLSHRCGLRGSTLLCTAAAARDARVCSLHWRLMREATRFEQHLIVRCGHRYIPLTSRPFVTRHRE